ncbi:unnamed protein product [Camellia sinensis]
MARAGLSTNGTGPGYLGGMKYSDIVDFNLANNASVVFDEETDWIGYDDTESISNKLNFAPANGLGGYFFWAVGFDKNWTISAAGFHGMGLSKLNNGGKSLMRAKGSMDNLHERVRIFVDDDCNKVESHKPLRFGSLEGVLLKQDDLENEEDNKPAVVSFTDLDLHTSNPSSSSLLHTSQHSSHSSN